MYTFLCLLTFIHLEYTCTYINLNMPYFTQIDRHKKKGWTGYPNLPDIRSDNINVVFIKD